jgi:hypothetical protein
MVWRNLLQQLAHALVELVPVRVSPILIGVTHADVEHADVEG